MRHFIAGCLIAVFGNLAAHTQAPGCELYTGRPRSLLDNYLNAPILVVGWMTNAVPSNNAVPNGQTELVLDDVIIAHDILKGRKKIVLPRVHCIERNLSPGTGGQKRQAGTDSRGSG